MAGYCPFCDLESEPVWEGGTAFAIRDKYPISAGHTLVCPRRHVADFFECSEQEQQDLIAGVNAVKRDLELYFGTDVAGWNIGINVGQAAGQTVFHVHLHLVPRFIGDVEDPRGGVRHIISDKADYPSD